MKLFSKGTLTDEGKAVAEEIEATLRPMITGLIGKGVELPELAYLIMTRANYLAAYASVRWNSRQQKLPEPPKC